ncbi:MAG: S8 family serine peptidase [Anaerolineae bacterium]|nr:S8 family serine peptidase [Anaerolineae bacterium]
MGNRGLQIILLLLTLALLVLVAVNAPVPLLLVLLLVLFLLLLWWLFGGSDEAVTEEFPNPDYPPEQFFVQNEVVVRGSLSGVERAVAAVSQSVQIRRKDRIAFGDLDGVVRACLADCSQIDFSSFIIDLYELDGSYEDVAAAVRAINQAVGQGSDVQAEPNWLSGHPWDPTGSPWDPTGSPWDPTGSSHAEDHYAPSEFFMKQWAFTEIGLHENVDRGRGQGVRIGVFDTSPYAADSAKSQSPLWVDAPTPLTLALAHYPVPAPGVDDFDLSSHGLFVAGLAHAVAPEATIQLIRVLGNHNVGDMFSLNLALFEFIRSNAAGQPGNDSLGAVINLSLGIRVPPDEAAFRLPTTVQSLRDLLRAAQCANIVVVAAAGNNSANLPQPEPANLPANWPEIIGVASSTQEQGRSCFSNQGDLAAPGGNGRSDDKDKPCVPANDACKEPDCAYSVIGPVLKTDSDTGFVYWSGTSFAAPMVTGLAALVIEKGGGRLSPQAVRRIIECGATFVSEPDLGNRIIHVANTLARFEECAREFGIDLDSPDQQTAA